MPKFAANLTMLFTELPFLDRFAAAAEAGFDGVEFLFPYAYDARQIKERLDENNLQLVLFNTAPGDADAGEWGVAAVPGKESLAREHIHQALDYACALDCPQVHVMAGVVQPGMARELCERVFIDNMRYAAELFAQKDKRLLIEALNPDTKPNYLYHSQYQTLDMIKRIDRPNVFTQLDFYHAQKVDGNLSRLITEFAGKYQHIQIASLPDRHEPDEGEINYDWIYDLLDKTGYQGWIGCEYIPRADTLSGLGWFSQFRSQ
ncbi:hydroxypyruvate isomerase [Salmonella enterica subsp. enterica serovar Choleraesuis]|nr:hydroxypyruvate isomerase [Salmonella enterica subsp. enterica serovar Choleraesuis]